MAPNRPVNPRDMPWYFLNTTGEAMAIFREVGRNNVKLQLALNHCRIMEGDLATNVRTLAGEDAYVQIAGVPERARTRPWRGQ